MLVFFVGYLQNAKHIFYDDVTQAMCAMCRDRNVGGVPVEDLFDMFDKDNDGELLVGLYVPFAHGLEF